MPSTLGAVHRAGPVHQVSQPGLGCPDKAAPSSVVTHHCTLFLGDLLLITLIKWLQTVLLKIFFSMKVDFWKICAVNGKMSQELPSAIAFPSMFCVLLLFPWQ